MRRILTREGPLGLDKNASWISRYTEWNVWRAGIRSGSAGHRRSRHHAAARYPQAFCRSMPQAVAAAAGCAFGRSRSLSRRNDFESEIRERVDSVRRCARTRNSSKLQALKLPSPETYDVVIAAVFVRVADRKGSVGLPGRSSAHSCTIACVAGKPVIVAGFGSPYLSRAIPGGENVAGGVFSNAGCRATRRGARDLRPDCHRRAVFPSPCRASRSAAIGTRCRRRPDDARTRRPRRSSARLKTCVMICSIAPSRTVRFPAESWPWASRQLAMHPFGRLTYERNLPQWPPTRFTMWPR